MSEFREDRRLFDQRVVDLGVGNFGTDEVATVVEDTPLVEVLELLSRCGVPSVPILGRPPVNITGASSANERPRDGQSDRVVVDVYCRSYVTYLTKIRPSSIISVLNSPVCESGVREMGLGRTRCPQVRLWSALSP